MSLSRCSLHWLARIASLAVLSIGLAHANQLVYVSLDQPCRLLDTRASTGGPGPLTADHGAYLLGTSDADIKSAAQHGSSSGCGIPNGIGAISVNMSLLGATASGNITTWSTDTIMTTPNIGTAVYNPTVASASPGQVQYNAGYTNVPVGIYSNTNKGRFYLQVVSGQIDMTVNVVGYWLLLAIGETRSGAMANAFGFQSTASGVSSVAMGSRAAATGDAAVAMGEGTAASGIDSTAGGWNTKANGTASFAMGASTVASGYVSTAMGWNTTADGDYATAIGSNVSNGNLKGSFIYGDASDRRFISNTISNQFVVAAYGGITFYTGESSGKLIGAELRSGSSSWTTASDRNAKTAIRAVDTREVLDKIVAMPINTWQYKTQEAKYRHIGPMAQDFYAAFHLGESDTGIDTVDADGVALAAIQGLHALWAEKEAKATASLEALRNEKDREIAALRQELSAQKMDIATQALALDAQTARIALLESIANEFAGLKSRLVEPDRSSSATVSVVLPH